MVPLLQLISRGSPMSFEDSNRIIPLFYLFSSLFSHSLISVHDSEFFGHEMEGSAPSTTFFAFQFPFSLFFSLLWRLLFPAHTVREPSTPLTPSPKHTFTHPWLCRCENRYLRTGVNQFCLAGRSDAVLHDALHAVGAGDAVALSEGRLPGNH